jgi:hypothetical protein
MYYPADASTEGLSSHRISNNIIHADFQPLAGASIILITETSHQDKVGTPRILKIMEERENIGYTIEEMGARWIPTLDSNVETITHAIWIGADNVPGSNDDTIWKRIASDALNKLSICQSMDIREFLFVAFYYCSVSQPSTHISFSFETSFESCCELLLARGHTQVESGSTLE